MGFFKKLSSLFSAPGGAEDASYWVVVQCNRCGEQVRARVDTRNDLSIQYGEGNGSPTYFCRKVLIGEGHCFQRMEVELTFDQDRKLIDRKVQGGKFVDEANQ